MSVKKDPSGRRSVEVEIEVPGTPEQVWQAIATGPGVSAWFVPTVVEPGEGGESGTVVTQFAPDMEGRAKATAWEPPYRFAAESKGLGPDAPALATEWIVEARAGGTCIVRVVHSLFSSSADWDDQLEDMESGWPFFFHILRVYLTHFRGQQVATFRVMSASPQPAEKIWEDLSRDLGLAGVGLGQKWSTPATVPPLAGAVDRLGNVRHPYLRLARLERPAPGVAYIGVHAMGGMSFLMVNVYLYGDQAPAAVTHEEPRWQAWLSERFPTGQSMGAVC